MAAMPNVIVCGEHLTLLPPDQIPAEYERIPCPLDPKHTVFKSQLSQHTAKCNARPKPLLPCHLAHVNAPRAASGEISILAMARREN